MLHPARFFRNFDRKVGHEIFVKTEKTEYLSNQLTYAHFDLKFIFPIKFGTSDQIFIFWISKMSQISGTATVNSYRYLTMIKNKNSAGPTKTFCEKKIFKIHPNFGLVNKGVRPLLFT